MITYLRSKESPHGTEEGGATMMPPGAKPIPLPKPKKPTTGTDIHQRCVIILLFIIIMIKYTYIIIYPHTHGHSTGLPTEEEGENIYDQPKKGVECSSPPPTEPEYYNQSMITYSRRKKFQRGTEGGDSAMTLPGAKPIPPPKPKKGTDDYKRTGTLRHQSALL